MGNGAMQLYNAMRKRIMTTMIGALASLEEYKDIFEEEEYEQLRTDILDKGHFQIKGLERDLDDFEIKFKTVYFMPLRRDNGKV
jgi:ribosome maturation protein Sdo1